MQGKMKVCVLVGKQKGLLQNASEKEPEQSPRKGLAAPALCFRI
jgi:hypothetical protein